MEVVRDSFFSFADWLFGLIRNMLASLWSDSTYRAGFFACFITLLVVGVLQQIIGWAWALIQTFFGHTAAPSAPGVGPTPAGITGGCVQGAGILIVAGLVLAALLYALFSGIGATP